MLRDEQGSKAIIQEHWFESIIALILIINIIAVGIEVDVTRGQCYSGYPFFWMFTNSFFAGVYVIEFSLKLAQYRSRCFHSRTRVLEFICVLVAILDTWVIVFVLASISVCSFSFLHVVRVVRMSRIFAFMTRQSDIRLILFSISDLYKVLVPMVLAMGVILYLTALVMTVFFVSGRDDWVYPSYSRWSGDEYWGSILRSMYTLFQVSTGDRWAQGVARPLLRVYPLYSLIFIPFVATMCFAFKATLVARLCDEIILSGSVADARLKGEEEGIKRAMDKLRENFECMKKKSGSAPHELNFKELSEFTEKSENRILFSRLNIAVSDVSEFFFILDPSGKGLVTAEAFFGSMHRLTGVAMGRDVTSIHMQAQKVHYRISLLSLKLARLEEFAGRVLRSLAEVAKLCRLIKTAGDREDDVNVINFSL